MNISIKKWLHWNRGVSATTAELCNATNSRFSLISRHHPTPPRRTSHIVGDGKAFLVREPDHTIKTPRTQTVKSFEMCSVTILNSLFSLPTVFLLPTLNLARLFCFLLFVSNLTPFCLSPPLLPMSSLSLAISIFILMMIVTHKSGNLYLLSTLWTSHNTFPFLLITIITLLISSLWPPIILSPSCHYISFWHSTFLVHHSPTNQFVWSCRNIQYYSFFCYRHASSSQNYIYPCKTYQQMVYISVVHFPTCSFTYGISTLDLLIISNWSTLLQTSLYHHCCYVNLQCLV